MTAAHVIALRHGATGPSIAGLYTGRSDPELAPRGREQAQSWAPVLGPLNAVALTSPLRRAVETAQAAGLEALPMAELAEWDLGSLDGLHAADYRAAHPEWNLYRDGPPGGTGESPEAVLERAERVLAEVQAVPDGTVVVLSTHGQFVRVLCAAALGASLETASRMSAGPGRASILTARAGRFSLTGWNVAPTPDLLKDLT